MSPKNSLISALAILLTITFVSLTSPVQADGSEVVSPSVGCNEMNLNVYDGNYETVEISGPFAHGESLTVSAAAPSSGTPSDIFLSISGISAYVGFPGSITESVLSDLPAGSGVSWGIQSGSGSPLSATWTVSCTPYTAPGAPTITSITPGNAELTVNFTAGASGSQPIINYEYSIDGGITWTPRSPFSTASPIIITGLTNDTSYNVQVRAFDSSVGSGAASATSVATPIAPPAPIAPLNNNFADAIALTATTTIGTNAGATMETNEYDWPDSAILGSSIWYTYSPADSGTVVLDTCSEDTDLDTVIVMWEAPLALPTNSDIPLTRNDDGCGESSSGSLVTFAVASGRIYYIQLGGYEGEDDPFTLTLTERFGAPANNDFANRTTFTGIAMAGSNDGATMQDNEYNFRDDLGGSIWYEWVSTVDQRIRLDTCTSDFDTLLVVWEGLMSWPRNGSFPVARNDDGCDDDEVGSEVTFYADAGVTYFFQVGGYVAPDREVDKGDFTLNMAKGTTAPTSVTAVPGDSSVTLTWTAPPVVAGADPNVGYQIEYSDDPSNNFVAALGECAPELTEISTMTQCEATGVLNGTTYYFSVRAIAPVVWSSWSLNSNAVTPRTAPDPTPNPTPGGGSISPTPIVPLAPVADPTPETQSAVAPTPDVAVQPMKATEMKVIKRIISFRSGSAQLTKPAKKMLKIIARDSRSAKKTETTVSARLIPAKATEANRILANQRTASICRYLKASKLRGTCAKNTWILQPGSKDFGPRVNLRQVREIYIR
jgi:hypothetical protein